MVMLVNLKLISNYINKMTKDDVYNIAFNKGMILSDKEVDIVYAYVKNNYNKFLCGKINTSDILKDAKKHLSEENYNKFLVLYDQFKDKI